MVETIQDRHVVAVLRPFVRATTPMLEALRTSDPLGLVRRVLPAARHLDGGGQEPAGVDGQNAQALQAVPRTARERLLHGLESVKVPGTDAWAHMTVAERDRWWINRVGRFTVLLASIPGLAGALSDRLPVQDTLALAGQGLLLCAIAAEHGVTSQADRVRLLAAVLFRRDITPAEAAATPDPATETQRTAELTSELTESSTRHGKITLKAAARTLWRLGKTLLALGDELDKRPQGRIYHRALGLLPVIGIAGDYLGERSALKRAAKAATKWLAANT
ncbi:MAG TPA: hypothetical protein VGX25_21255 [Actinophytocola sp.]|uniref:hypothetical protein n=1 Tax=Actinophytocola sp. TaxID=1872138 RepID=UPI002DDCC791|nr:hypothetical protein [Actinophytocola sp.]HEV2781924.1 hypothetical protein [Actinophytocola sp.]